MGKLVIFGIALIIGILLCLGALDEFPLKESEPFTLPWFFVRVPFYVICKCAYFCDEVVELGIVGGIFGAVVGLFLGTILMIFTVVPWVLDLVCMVGWCFLAII